VGFLGRLRPFGMTQGRTEPMERSARQRRIQIGLCAALALVTVAVFLPLHRAGFVNFDDPNYVTENPGVRAGLSLAAVKWAFSTGYAANWFPLTWISHMLDIELFGFRAGFHHLVSLLLHVVSVVALFLALDRMTHARGRSAFVAALFAWHPLHVESVAWIAERKDVLSTVFFMLTLLAYARYVERPRLPAMLLVVLSCALGLLAKAMLVTLPFVLLLLDLWPLGRLTLGNPSRIGRLVFEKIPLFVLSACAAVATLVAQRAGGAIMASASLPLGVRIGNAVTGYVRYVVLAFWPHDLAFFYPIVLPHPAWRIVTSVVVLLAITAIAVVSIRTKPYVAVGWLWFVGMLVPTIGLVQVGGQAIADRYTYVPVVGLFILSTWGLGDVLARLRRARAITIVGATVVLIACAILSRRQVAYWANDRSLYEHALAVTKYNWMAHKHLGYLLMQEGDLEGARRHFATTLRLLPTEKDTPELLFRAEMDLASAAARRGRFADAATMASKAEMVARAAGLIALADRAAAMRARLEASQSREPGAD
jgi:protein O-mannosyl-transferase